MKYKDLIYSEDDLEFIYSTGIYKIWHIEKPLDLYIGSTGFTTYPECNGGFARRWIVHLRLLKNNKHHNRHLQFVVNKYGIEGLRLSIIETCSENFIAREQHYIDTLNSTYNHTPAGKVTKVPTEVYQYDCYRNFIRHYKSITDAAKYTGIDHSSIVNVCLNKRSTAGGYLWSYTDIPPDYPKSLKPIGQYSLEGKLIRIYDRLEQVITTLNLKSRTAIKNCFTGKQKQAYGFIWKKLTPDEAANLKRK